jgi:predicted TPR repeat methyltransferase
MIARLQKMFATIKPFIAKDFLKGKVKEAKDFCGILRERMKNLEKSNLELALYHYNQGNSFDTRLRFWIYERFWNKHPDTKFFIARTYIEVGKFDKAMPYITEYLQTKTGNYIQEAAYCQYLLNDQLDKISVVPLEIVGHFYQVFSKVYQDVYIYNNNDNIEDVTFNTLAIIFNQIGRPYGNNMLHLGLGTGYLGQLLKQSKTLATITGIDISPRMVELAKTRRFELGHVYDEVFESDIYAYLDSAPKKVDVVLFDQIMNHDSRISKILEACNKLLDKNGLAVLNFAVSDELKDLQFVKKSEEFIYSEAYVANIVKDFGWNIMKTNRGKILENKDGVCMVICKNI